LACPHPSPLPSLGEGARDCDFLSGSPSPNSGRRGWGMRAKGLECTQLVLNLELLLIDKAIAFSSYLTIIPQFRTESSMNRLDLIIDEENHLSIGQYSSPQQQTVGRQHQLGRYSQPPQELLLAKCNLLINKSSVLTLARSP
jgi:hypothetical protein